MSENMVGHSVDLSNLPQPNEEPTAQLSALPEPPDSGIDVSASAPETATSAFVEPTPALRTQVVDVGAKSDASAHKNPLHAS